MERRSIMGKIGGYRSAASQADMRALHCDHLGDTMGALIWRAKADAWRSKCKKWEARLVELDREG